MGSWARVFAVALCLLASCVVAMPKAGQAVGASKQVQPQKTTYKRGKGAKESRSVRRLTAFPQFDMERACVELVLGEMLGQVAACGTEVFEKAIFCEVTGEAATSSFRGKKTRAAGRVWATAPAVELGQRHLVAGPPTAEVMQPFPQRDDPKTEPRTAQTVPPKPMWDAVEALG
jgi:hypothetical protein